MSKQHVETVGMKELEGTQTLVNLQQAFEDEALAVVRYGIYAEYTEDFVIKEMFQRIAQNELEHAEVMAQILGAIGSQEENVKKSVAFEAFQSGVNYPNMAKIAEDEGFHEIAERFRLVGAIEATHKAEFEHFLKLMDKNSLYKRPQKTRWTCSECGYSVEGIEAPEKCPFCGHGQDDFYIE